MKTLRDSKYQEALQRAESGSSLRNELIVIAAFAERGFDPKEIQPRVNVLTFDAWIAKGRIVAKGQHGVKVTTVMQTADQEDETGRVRQRGRRFMRTTTVFHISQTKPLKQREENDEQGHEEGDEDDGTAGGR